MSAADALTAVGLVCIALGAALIYFPAGLVVFGALCAALGIGLVRGDAS